MFNRYRGFTIVELLIVIVVIGILAAISIVAYNVVSNRANDSTIRSDLSNIPKQLELTRAELGRYPETLSEMPDFRVSKASYHQSLNNVYYCLDKANQIYAFGARSKSTKGFIQTSRGLIEDVAISGSATCTAIDKVWTSDATTFVVQGYYSGSYPATGGWNPNWKWTQ